MTILYISSRCLTLTVTLLPWIHLTLKVILWFQVNIVKLY